MSISPNLSVLEAASVFKKSKATLYKHMKTGKLSKNNDGSLNMSELIRCYGEPSQESLTVENKTVSEGRMETELRQRVELLEKLLEESKKREEIALDREMYQRQQATALQQTLKLLEDKTVPAKRKGFIGRLLG